MIGLFGLMPGLGFLCNIPVDIVNTVLTRKLLTPKQLVTVTAFIDCALTACEYTLHVIRLVVEPLVPETERTVQNNRKNPHYIQNSVSNI